MDPEIGRAALRLATFITLTSAVLLLFTVPGSAEFVVATLALLVGLVFATVVVWLARKGG